MEPTCQKKIICLPILLLLLDISWILQIFHIGNSTAMYRLFHSFANTLYMCQNPKKSGKLANLLKWQSPYLSTPKTWQSLNLSPLNSPKLLTLRFLAVASSLLYFFQNTSKLAALLTQAVYTPNQYGVKDFSGKSRLARLKAPNGNSVLICICTTPCGCQDNAMIKCDSPSRWSCPPGREYPGWAPSSSFPTSPSGTRRIRTTTQRSALTSLPEHPLTLHCQTQ